jgi:GAF domain-containing protein
MDLSQANRLAEMALDMTEQPNLTRTVERIVFNTRESIPCDGVSIVLVQETEFEWTQATDDRAEKADALQLTLRQGPSWSPAECLDTQVINDLADERRWPKWRAQVLELGWRSMLSIRLFTPVRTLGVLNLYADRAGAFAAPEVEELARIFGRHASIALMGAQSSESLRSAVASRHVIGQAQGILMERYQVDSDRAFTVLRRYSQDRNIKLRLIAEQVISTHRLPE